MSEYHEELERRIEQFARFLKKMHHRTFEEIYGNCFIIFDDRDQSSGSGNSAITESLKPTLELVAAGFDEARFSCVTNTEESFPFELAAEGWKQNDSQKRFIQFAFGKNWFCLDIPLQTLYRAEAEQILRSRKGFFYLQDRLEFILTGEIVDGYDPFRKIFVYGDEDSAAEDMAFIFFQIWRFPVDWRFFVTAGTFCDQKTDWEDFAPIE